ncbi:hypothetical protein F4604DRAFT_1976884 [Suillus subluteus]|nr:hypothetical protein F4604DRAFT_1976884 [Suillus subluteus]
MVKQYIHRIFSQGLQQMSTEGVRRAAYYKEAELEYHHHLSMTLAWEAEKLSRLKHFLDGKQQVQEDKTTQAFEEAALFTRMVVDRDSERASQDVAFITAVQKNEVKRITRLNAELDELDALLPLDLSASDFDNADTHSIRDLHHSDHSYVGDPPEDGLVMRFVNFVFCLKKITIMDTTVPSRRRVSRDVPIIRQAGLNIAGHPSADQLGCVSETPESMNTPELPPRTNPPPVFLHDGYSSIPPSYQLEGGDTASRYRMVYTYMPLRGAEKSRQEYTDSVVYRDETTGIQKTSTRRYQLPPIRPLRESLAADSEITPNAATSSTPQSTTSTLQSSALTVTVAHTGRKGCSGATVVPVIDKAHMKIVIKDVKESVIAETVNICGFHDSSSRLSVATTALSDACSSIIMQVQVDHNKSTVDFLTGNNSINYIFGSLLEDGREVCYPFEHKAVIQIASRACFRDGYDKFIHSDTSLDNIMAMSATAACCGLLEFATGIFKQIDFTYTSFHAMYMKLMKFIHENIRSSPTITEIHMYFHQSHAFATEVMLFSGYSVPSCTDRTAWKSEAQAGSVQQSVARQTTSLAPTAVTHLLG